MGNFVIKDPPEYSSDMRMLETTDPNHANVFNQLFELLINNDSFFKTMMEKLIEAEAVHVEDGTMHVTPQDKVNWNAKADDIPATAEQDGLLSAGDKRKLDNMEAGAEVNQNAYSNIKVGTVTIQANGKMATFVMEAGDNITLTGDNASKKIIIEANRDGGNADTVDGHHAEHFATADHGHDGRYYTKTESDTLLKGKAASSHSHNVAAITDLAANYFKMYTLDSINIDSTPGNWSVDIGSVGHGTVPEIWVNVQQYSSTHFWVQYAHKIVNSTDGNRKNGKIWVRNRYSSGVWSSWNLMYSQETLAVANLLGNGTGFTCPGVNGGDLNNYKSEYHGFVYNAKNIPSGYSYGFLDVTYFSGSGFTPAPYGVVRQVFTQYSNGDVLTRTWFKDSTQAEHWSGWRRCLDVNGTAAKATADANGNNINQTYIKSIALSDKGFQFQKGNDTWHTVTLYQSASATPTNAESARTWTWGDIYIYDSGIYLATIYIEGENSPTTVLLFYDGKFTGVAGSENNHISKYSLFDSADKSISYVGGISGSRYFIAIRGRVYSPLAGKTYYLSVIKLG